MKHGHYMWMLLLICFGTACSPTKKIIEEVPVVKIPIPAPAVKTTPPESAAQPEDPFFKKLFKNDAVIPDSLRKNVQIIYTEIKRSANGRPFFTDHYLNKTENYFYPSAAVKLPLAILALQKLNELKSKGVTATATMLTGIAYQGQTEVYNDPNSPDGKPTLERYIKRALLINDTEACDRLYEFLGGEYINAELKRHGYSHSLIVHRPGKPLTDEENRHTNPVVFYDSLNRIVYAQPSQNNKTVYPPRYDSLEKSYRAEDKMIKGRVNMSSKNKFSLEDMHKMIASLFYPEAYPGMKPFAISAGDRSFLITLLGQDPGESVWPSYKEEKYNGFTKYLYFGGEKDRSEGLRSYNTSGIGYGTIAEAAYFKDAAKNTEWFVSSVTYCNMGGLTDQHTENCRLGISFLKKVGQAIYDHEREGK